MWMTRQVSLAAALVPLVSSFGSARGQCSTYQVQTLYGYDCGVLGYSGVDFRGINDAGNACGGIGYCDTGADMIVWSGERILLQVPLTPQFNLQALSINDENVIAGIQQLPSGQNRGFVYLDGEALLLNPLPGHNWSEAYSIANDGTVVGYSNGSPEFWAVRWQDLEPSVLTLPIGPRSKANDISNSGNYICGWMGIGPSPNFGSSAFRWHIGDVVDLGLLPGTSAAEARGVNNFGQVCGIAYSGGGRAGITRHGFFWSNRVMQDVGILPGYTQCMALDVNDSGQVIGRCFNNAGEAFVWQNGVMQALTDLIPPELGLTITSAWTINHAGQIAGMAIDDDFNQIGIRLTPIPSPTGDFNGDCINDWSDILSTIKHWHNPTGPGRMADYNADGDVNALDLIITIQNWT
jgi:probable HAF family extracellular repeat protein